MEDFFKFCRLLRISELYVQMVAGEIGDIEAKPNDLKGLFSIKDFKNIKKPKFLYTLDNFAVLINLFSLCPSTTSISEPSPTHAFASSEDSHKVHVL